MNRKRKETCPSPILDEIPKRTKVQAQRKFAQNSGVHSPIITPIRDLETADLLPRTSILPEPVELLPMKRPNTEDFLTFLCFRGTPILPSNLQFFNTASIVADGQVHEIKGDSPKNGPIDITKCAGSSSDKPFIAFGVRKRADPIVISRQMDRKRRHALAIQALRRRYQEQKMAKIRALTISKLSEKTTNKTLVKTNTIQKTETVTKKTMQKTKVIATKHVKVTTQTLKTSLKPKVKPRMCLRSFRGKIVQKELPFKAKRTLAEKARPDLIKAVVRTSKNSNKIDKPKKVPEKLQLANINRSRPERRVIEIVKSEKASSGSRITRSGSISNVIRTPNTKANLQRALIKRRIILQPTTVSSIIRPRLRSTTVKKTVISRKKARQRVPSKTDKSINVLEDQIKQEPTTKQSTLDANKKGEKELSKKRQDSAKKSLSNEVKNKKDDRPKKSLELPKRITRRDSELVLKPTADKSEKNESKKEITKNLELKKKVKIAETDLKKEVRKNVNLKREFNLKTNSKMVKKNVDLKKTSDTVLEKNENGQDVKQDVVKTVELTVKKIVTKQENKTEQKKSTTEQCPITSKRTPNTTRASARTASRDHQGNNSENFKQISEDLEKKNIQVKKAAKEVKSKDDKAKKNQLKEGNINNTATLKNDKDLEDKNGEKTKPTKEIKDQSLLKNPQQEVKLKELKEIAKPPNKKHSSEVKVKESKEIEKIMNSPQNSPNKKQLQEAKSKESKEMEKLTNSPNKKQSVTEKHNTKEPSTSDIPKKTEPLKKDIPTKKNTKETINKKDESPKRKPSLRKEDPEPPKAPSRPSRKTKEAAAIYMEILSHKLVNDSQIDDDNISIDSFPELPNVKKTEKREIELKAQAKKEDEKIVNDDVKQSEIVDNKKGKKVIRKEVLERSSKRNTPEPTLNKSVEKRSNFSPKNYEEQNQLSKNPTGKRKISTTLISDDSDSDNEVLQAKIRKSENQKAVKSSENVSRKIDTKKVTLKSSPEENVTEISPTDETSVRRLTRRSTQAARLSDSDSSDESFRIDVRVPRKKKLTRSSSGKVKSVSVLEKNVDIILEAARVLEAELEDGEVVLTDTESKVKKELPCKSVESKPLKEEKEVKVEAQRNLKDVKSENIKKDISDSAESTTSDINLKSLQTRQRNKKLTKIQGSQSSIKSNFSDSDEEPLAKLTNKSVRSAETEASSKKFRAKKVADKTVVMEGKPKRECTKRPSNYLPMLSSSEEDEESFFHGFNTEPEEPKKPKVFVQTLAPSLDLLSKGIGRKGKVNMSNEQIEQWLKDSALAGSGVAKENDDMLKFGERIPSEVSRDRSETPSISDSKQLDTETKPVEEISEPSTSKQPSEPKCLELPKSPFADRKWIFKKEKKSVTPNKNAFSPENECSVYAFGEDDDIVSTPFRRPTRRPSSTATSRSEDEMTRNDENSKQGHFRKPTTQVDSDDLACFNIPQNPTKGKLTKSDTMVPPSTNFQTKRPAKPVLERYLEPFDDCKYKIPSSPSASSGSSAKLYKKSVPKQKGKNPDPIAPIYVSDFPKSTDPAKLVEAPVFHPTEQEFQDPLEYIERIRHKAEQFGICRIVPPSSFKPECKVSDDMRFTAYNQYVHKMLHRWGPNFKEFMAIRKYLATQNITLKTPPWIGGMEVDLPRLYQTVQSLGGLKEVIEKKKWPKVSDNMKIPKSAQDRVTKLDDIYCKYLLPYDTLSHEEREKLFDDVETLWAKRESKNLQAQFDQKEEAKAEEATSEQEDYESDENEVEECTVKGKNMALNGFYRIARNTMSMYFKVAEPTAPEVEQQFWRYVTEKQNHICVHSASIDCGNWGYGFPVSKNSPFARHAWNLKVLTNNGGSVLRSLGPTMGVTVPTLHVGMVFSTCCWYRDPHGLPWIEYLHTGGSKIWYGIPSSSCEVFHAAMQKLVPTYCRDKELWLPSDTAMVPPWMLMEHNVSLCRTVQEPGQFLVVFPKVFTSSISTGYVVSESVYFAPLYWLKTAKSLFNDLKNSCEPSMFSLDKLLISISTDPKSNTEALRVIKPFIEELVKAEKENRTKLRSLGKIDEEKMTPEVSMKKKKMQNMDGDFECEICRTNLYVSMVVDDQEDVIYCLDDAINLVIKDNTFLERLKLKYTFNEVELDEMASKIDSAIEGKIQKKIPSKFAGVTVPTLHVGMVFSTCCWYRDPHGLPWIEYLHTGGSKIWYGIPSSSCEVFHAAMQKLVPTYCRDKELWLPSDTAMVPPWMLMEHNVSLCRTVQEPGQFLVVFPKVFTSSISTGYVVSESVYFAPLYWLKTAKSLFNDLKNSCEPSMFSLDKLLISISTDPKSNTEALRVIKPFIEELVKAEKENRTKLRSLGKIDEEKMTPEVSMKKKKMQNMDGDFECEICRTNLYVSMVVDDQEDVIYCLDDAINLVIKDNTFLERLKLKYTFNEVELDEMASKIDSAIEGKIQKKIPSKFAGMPTLLK